MRTCHSRWDRRSGHAGLATPAVVVVIIFTVRGRLGIMDGGLRVTVRDMLGIIVRGGLRMGFLVYSLHP